MAADPTLPATLDDVSVGNPTQVIIVMGVSGCGKSTIGKMLADRVGWRFADADEFHPATNVEKMRAGIALTDEDRWPWLERLNAVMRHSVSKGEPMVMACSALKQRYRDVLADRLDGLRFVYLKGSFELILARAQARHHDYMPASLLRSQFDTLEPPTDAWTYDITIEPAQIAEQVADRLTR